MAFGGQNPGIWGESVRKALNSDEERHAHDNEAGAERALLDTAELRDMERSEFYGETRPVSAPAPVSQSSGLRGFLARLFGRSA
jgi:hypothetical protein